MIKYLVFLLWTMALQGGVAYDVSHYKNSELLSPYMEYLADTHNNLTVTAVQSSTQFAPMIKSNFGNKAYFVWTKLVLRNPSSKPRSLVLYNVVSGTDEVRVYYLRNDQIIQTYRLGDMIPFAERPIPDRHIAVPITVGAQEELTILTRVDNRTGMTVAEWRVMAPNAYAQFNIRESMFYGAFAGVIFAFVLYNLMIYLSLRKSAFLFYTLYGVTLLSYQYLINSVFYEWQIFDAGVLNDLKHPVGFSVILFILLFNMSFFATRDNFKKIHRVSTIMVWGNLLLIIAMSFSLNTPWFYGINLIGHYFVIVSLIYLWVLGIYFILQKRTGALFYTLGQGTFFIAAMYHIISSMGVLDNSFIHRYINIAGIVIDMIFLSMALGQRLKIINQEKEKNEKILLLTSRFASMGQMVGNISHQWKVPLVKLGSLMMELESRVWVDSKNLKEEITEVIPKMRETLRFMDDTIHEFSEFYKSDKAKVSFSIKKQIEEITELLSAKSIALDAKIVINDCCDFDYYGFKNAFAQVVMIIVDNALDIAQTRGIKSPIIKIYSVRSENGFSLHIEDNCGGIEQNPIESVFELFASQETGSNSGMGLAIAKKMVKYKLKGEIFVENTSKGAKFLIKFDF